MADNSEIRNALLLLSSRTGWVTETQHRTFDAAVCDYFADTPDEAPAVETAPGVELAKVGDSAPSE